MHSQNNINVEISSKEYHVKIGFKSFLIIQYRYSSIIKLREEELLYIISNDVKKGNIVSIIDYSDKLFDIFGSAKLSDHKLNISVLADTITQCGIIVTESKSVLNKLGLTITCTMLIMSYAIFNYLTDEIGLLKKCVIYDTSNWHSDIHLLKNISLIENDGKPETTVFLYKEKSKEYFWQTVGKFFKRLELLGYTISQSFLSKVFFIDVNYDAYFGLFLEFYGDFKNNPNISNNIISEFSDLLFDLFYHSSIISGVESSNINLNKLEELFEGMGKNVGGIHSRKCLVGDIHVGNFGIYESEVRLIDVGSVRGFFREPTAEECANDILPLLWEISTIGWLGFKRGYILARGQKGIEVINLIQNKKQII